MTELEDVEAQFLGAARKWLEDNGVFASRWRVEWDGGPMTITALREGQTLREFVATPNSLQERDAYSGELAMVPEEYWT